MARKFIVRLKKKDEKEVQKVEEVKEIKKIDKINEVKEEKKSSIKINEDIIVGRRMQGANIKNKNTEVKVEEKKFNNEFEPSDAQNSIFSFIKNQVLTMQNRGMPLNLVAESGAGCAKTTTLIMSLRYIPETLKVLFCAFNKDIVDVVRDKVPSNVRVQTFHSAGLGALRYTFKNIKVDDKNKKMHLIYYNNLCNEKYSCLSDEVKKKMSSPFNKLCGLVKNALVEPTSENLWNLMEKYGMDIEDFDDELLFNMVRDGISISDSNPTFVDFNDMIYLPVKLNLQFYKSDIVYVDETQDLNNCQLKMLRMMVKPTGFIVCVGDRNQSIYSFRGADFNAIPRMIKELKAEIRSLMVTYRCGKNIVKLANELVPELEAYHKNEDGKVENISYDRFYELVSEGDMVLCRNNAPLIKPVFHLLSKGIKVSIKGRDIGEGLIRLVNSLKVFNISEFWLALDKWRDNEETKATRKKSDLMMQTIEDKYNCLSSIAENCKNVTEITGKINMIFEESRSEIVFSSIHRAKGLEPKKDKSVFILEPHLMPSKYAKKPDDMQQEKNIMYVAITRAKMSLFMVGGTMNTKF